jgi:hypothetical protein
LKFGLSESTTLDTPNPSKGFLKTHHCQEIVSNKIILA